LGDAIAAAFEGEDTPTALSRAQQIVDSYVACLSTLDRMDAKSSRTCAQQADPEYDTSS